MKPEVHLEKSDLDELERLCEAATPGPWIQMNGTVMRDDASDEDIAECLRLENDAVFIAAARMALPELVVRVRELEAEREWHPIETAPRDGTDILVRHEDPGNGHSIVRWSEESGCWIDENWDGNVSRDVPSIKGWKRP